MGNFFAKQKKKPETKDPEQTPVEPAPVEPAPAPAPVEPAAPAPEASSGGGDDAVSLKLCEEHNKLRKLHGCPPLEVDAELTKGAVEWANKLAKLGKLQHTTERIGENLAWKSGGEFSEADAVKMWYDEIKDYSWENPGFNGKTGHFTQVVWKSSTHFGGAIAYDENGAPYAVGRYSPPGNMNMPGYFEENVPNVV